MGLNPYFLSLEMIITGRWHDNASPYLTAMDLLAKAISDEESPPHHLIDFMFNEKGGRQ